MRAAIIGALGLVLPLTGCRTDSVELTVTPSVVDLTPTATLAGTPQELGLISASPDQTTITFQIDPTTGSIIISPSPTPGPATPTPYNGPHGDPAPVQSSEQHLTAVNSPDRKYIVYLRNDATTFKGVDTELVLSEGDGSSARDLTATPENEYYPLYWTSDSRNVVFWRDTISATDPGWSASNSILLRRNIDSGVETVIAPGILVGALALAWMPTGDRFAALATYNGTTKIVLVDVFTGDARTLAKLANDTQLRVGNLRWLGEHLLIDASSAQNGPDG